MTKKADAPSYRDLLMQEFYLRRKKNSSYSLRAFANHICLSPGFLSLLLNGKKNISLSTAGKIANDLKWTAEKKQYFLNLIEIENPRSDHSHQLALAQINSANKNFFTYDHFRADVFTQISEWQHTPILVLLTLKNTKNTTASISKKLGLTMATTKSSLARLERLGFVKQEKGIWISTKPFFKLPSAPSEAVRKYHKQMLNLAEKAIDEQSFDSRDFSNVTFTLTPEKIALAKNKISQFRQELSELLDCQKATEVYQLSIQLFSLTSAKEQTDV